MFRLGLGLGLGFGLGLGLRLGLPTKTMTTKAAMIAATVSTRHCKMALHPKTPAKSGQHVVKKNVFKAIMGATTRCLSFGVLFCIIVSNFN